MKRKENIDVVMPRLIKGEKKWFVEYSCYYPKTDRLEKFRVYKGINSSNDQKIRKKLGDKIVIELSKKLTSGWRPWNSSQYIYKDEIQYKNITLRNGNNKKNDSHLRKYLSEFLIDTKRRVSSKTYESYQSKTRLFCEWLENNKFEKLRIYEITPKIVNQFFSYLIDIRKLDPRTIEKYEQNIGQMFRYFMKIKLISENPLGKVTKPPKIKDLAARPIIDSDMRLLLHHISQKDEQLFLACLTQFFLCCRPGNELRLLKIQDIDLYSNIVHISQENGKTGARKITIPNALVELFNSYNLMSYPREYYVFSKNKKPGTIALGKNYFNRKFSEFKKELKLPGIYKFYSFKHTGAGKLLESGATLAELMSHLGHTMMESTYSYIRRHFGEKSKKVLEFKPEILNGII